jgi:hypothetical protein
MKFDDTSSDSDTKHVLLHSPNFSKINKLNAMRKRIKEIVIIEERPFSFLDFKSFVVDGIQHKLKHGVIRNYLSKLTRCGEIEFAYNSGISFYTLPGKTFSKYVTADHVGGSSSLLLHQLPIRNTPIYKWLRNRRIDKQALHNIRATFEANGIWTIFYKRYSNLVDGGYNNNKDIRLASLTFFEYLNVGITIHHSDTVSISIGCSFRPIALDVPDLLQLIEGLARTEMHLTNEINKLIAHDLNAPRVSVPRFTTWTVKMWHFGVDTLDEYDKEEFHVTFEEGVSDIFRIYTKRMKDKRTIVRAERQEYPNEYIMLALVKKLYPNGKLINSQT